MTRILVPVFLSLSFALIAIGWLLAGPWWAGAGFLLLLPVFLVLMRRKYAASLDLAPALLACVFMAGFGLVRGHGFGLHFAGLLSVLAAWDLNGFTARLAYAAQEDDIRRIERQHFTQLGGILILGSAVSLASLIIQLEFTFEWSMALALLTFLGIGALVYWLRGRET